MAALDPPAGSLHAGAATGSSAALGATIGAQHGDLFARQTETAGQAARVSVRGPVEGVRERESLTSALAVLRRRWLLVVGIVLASVLVLVASHERQAKTYAATASVAFHNGTLSGAALQVTPESGSEPQREANTEVLVAHSPEVARAAAAQLHLHTSAGELLEEVQVEAAPNANVLDVIATTSDPGRSASLANAFAEQYIAFKSQSQLAEIDAAQSKLQAQISALAKGSAERSALEQSLQRLGSARAVAAGGANIIGRATPPSSPTGGGVTTSVVIGLLIGLAVAFSLVFLLESLDKRVKSVEELEQDYRLPVLAGVPQSAFGRGRAERRTEELEPYRILRSALDFTAVTRPLSSLMVTSAVAGEGKTTVAVDLAHAIALTGRRTVLVEIDLRRPTFADQFELDPGVGLTDVLAGGMAVEELLSTPLADAPKLSVLPAGRLPHNPSELLGAPRIAEILAELGAHGAMVVIDAPPLNPVADAHVLLNNRAIDATLIVARLDRTTREEVRRARAILDRHVVAPVGIVVTGLRDGGRYGYGSYRGSTPTLDVDIAAVGAAPRRDRQPGLSG